MSTTAERRSRAAAMARQYFERRSIPLSAIEDAFRGTRDPLIEELIDLATHEPPTSDRAHYERKYRPHVAAVLEQLDRGEKGTLPPAGRWSLAKVLALAGLAVGSAAIAGVQLLNATPDDDFNGTRWCIGAVLAAIAFVPVLRQYLRARRRRSH